MIEPKKRSKTELELLNIRIGLQKLNLGYYEQILVEARQNLVDLMTEYEVAKAELEREEVTK
jgi:hypothetical protein